MPSLVAHPFVAAALAPWLRAYPCTHLLLLGAACTMLPDIDVIGHHLGVPYASMWGHRGFTHSLPFAAMLGLIVTLASKPRSLARFAFFFACTASHGVLDAMTDGGLGIAFLAPFDAHRWFLPWRPIDVSPLSVTRFFDGRGIAILLDEAIWIMLPALAVGAAGLLMRGDRPRPIR
jgi:inner membrane protein